MNTTNPSKRTTPDSQEEELDTSITSIRAEIQTLQKRKRLLTSSLLTTTQIQSLLRTPKTESTTNLEHLSPLVHAAGKHNTSNHHRIAFGVTTFPFKDPSPTINAQNKNLLGVRIDVCTRNGRFAKPYYVLLRSERRHAAGKESGRRLRVHRHTVPSFISVAKLEHVYLPRARRHEEGGDGDTSSEETAPTKTSKKHPSTHKQDLGGFVRELRRELVAWHTRIDAIDLLREWVGLVDSEGRPIPAEEVSPDPSTGIVGLAAVPIEARYVRVEWEDGRVGRFKLSNGGIVERAVVIGDAGRDKRTEDLMTGGGGRIEGILDRLRAGSGAVSPS
ncbi:hypothetical protein PENARI_c006G01188 [Penicillium arizonense]|uniref:Cenp-O kinetochore centromere component n=1 Tax=Penicillium arizonense TaxID=1835702 RepID=A0A1F5LN55_PENAI|nr:hypothetical protein PENARI_c006G01188 [Penicillium arizonense]OGE54359.1 hypothetical protein PENARI_c006G01188 [Penicillium arizonense]